MTIRPFLLTFLLVIRLLTSQAQETRPFTIGWFGGVGRSGPREPETVYITSPAEALVIWQEAKISGSAGMRLEAHLGGNATLRLDIAYNDRGYLANARRSLAGGPFVESTTRLRLGYLSVPLTARIPLHQGAAFVYVHGGGILDRLLWTSSNPNDLSTAPYAPWGLAYLFGLGASYPYAGDSRGYFELGFTRAISDYRPGQSWQPQALSLSVGWML